MQRLLPINNSDLFPNQFRFISPQITFFLSTRVQKVLYESNSNSHSNTHSFRWMIHVLVSIAIQSLVSNAKMFRWKCREKKAFYEIVIKAVFQLDDEKTHVCTYIASTAADVEVLNELNGTLFHRTRNSMYEMRFEVVAYWYHACSLLNGVVVCANFFFHSIPFILSFGFCEKNDEINRNGRKPVQTPKDINSIIQQCEHEYTVLAQLELHKHT